MTSRKTLITTALALLLLPALALAGGDWNDDGIDWKPYNEALELAKESGRPICLVFFTEWCGHCKNYSKVFHDKKLVEKSKKDWRISAVVFIAGSRWAP